MNDRLPESRRRTSLRGRSRECAALDGLVLSVRQSDSRSLLLRGEAGIGKTALLEYLVESASADVTIARAGGVEAGGGSPLREPASALRSDARPARPASGAAAPRARDRLRPERRCAP